MAAIKLKLGEKGTRLPTRPSQVLPQPRSGFRSLRPTWSAEHTLQHPLSAYVNFLRDMKGKFFHLTKVIRQNGIGFRPFWVFFGGLKLIHLTSQEVAKYRDARLAEVTPASLKRELTIFSQALTTTSNDWGIAVPQNPIKMISLPKADKPRTRRLEPGEETKLLQSSNQKLRRVIILALETAMRRGEILFIKRSHIDFQKSVLLIPSTKTDTPRTIGASFNRCYNGSQRRIEGFSKRI